MIKTGKLVDQISKEIDSIMEVQERLGSETEAYKHNEEAVKIYVELLGLLDEAYRKDRELDLRELEEKRLTLELELKAHELKETSDSKLRSDIFDLAKTALGIVAMLILMGKTFKFEETGVFSSKISTPLLGSAIRLFSPK